MLVGFKGWPSAGRNPLMATAHEVCEHCGRARRPGEFACGLCGALAPRANPTAVTTLDGSGDAEARPATPAGRASAYGAAPGALLDASAVLAEPEPAWRTGLHLGLGLLIAPVFFALPFLGAVLWFLSAIAHEMSHSAVAWVCGLPSMPAISLAGEAVAIHGERSWFLTAMIVAGLASLAWRLEGRRRRIAVGALAVAYPLVAFTGLREVLFLAAGHAGEIAIAGVFLSRSISGHEARSAAERTLYATVGWAIALDNGRLTLGLMTSDAARAHYADNGSFGLVNDYLRLAREHLGVRLQTVAFSMLLFELVLLGAILAATWIGVRAR